MPRQTAIERGIKPTLVCWVDVSKGDENKCNVRCRLVGKELKAKTKDAPLSSAAHCLRGRQSRLYCHFSRQTESQIPKNSQKSESSYCMQKVDRELYIEFPDEARDTRRRRCCWTAEPHHARIQRCMQQLFARLAESSPVSRVRSWQGQSWFLQQTTKLEGCSSWR